MQYTKLYEKLSPLLAPFSKYYARLMQKRREKYYTKSATKQFRAEVPVISVGNISWGGTGKTPVVEHLMTLAHKRSIKPAVLTRGYGGEPPQLPLVVTKDLHPSEAGDEPLMLADALPEASIIVDPKRSRAAEYVQKNIKSNVLILDDGFQHLAMKRDLDLVLFSQNDLYNGWNKIIPEGTWREPKSALEYAHAFIIKTSPNKWQELKKQFYDKLEDNAKPFFAFSLKASDLIYVHDSKPKETLTLGEYTFITAIGNPDQAYESARDFLGKPAEITKFYDDHYSYTKEDATYLRNLKMPIVCTHKDAIKLKKFYLPNIYYIKSKLVFWASYGTDLPFDKWVDNWWEEPYNFTSIFDKDKEYYDISPLGK